MDWFNPQDVLPECGQHVVVAIGVPEQMPNYRDAQSCGANGGFNVQNGSYGTSTLYRVGHDDAIGNAIKVLAWSPIEPFTGVFHE